MKKQVEGVTEKILSAAEKEFLEYGFHGASLRRIAAAGGVSTHTIYTRFGDKAGLFDALVKDAAQGLFDVYLGAIGLLDQCGDYSDMTKVGTDGTNDVLDYIYQHFTAFQLIFCCSAGTEYEDYLDRLSRIEEEAYRGMNLQLGGTSTAESDFFIHVICSSSWLPVYEVVSHNMPMDAARRFMNLQIKYHHAGWQSVLGLLNTEDC